MVPDFETLDEPRVLVLDPIDRESTIYAMVIDMTAREMHIAWAIRARMRITRIIWMSRSWVAVSAVFFVA
jgi:hypothetical protein